MLLKRETQKGPIDLHPKTNDDVGITPHIPPSNSECPLAGAFPSKNMSYVSAACIQHVISKQRVLCDKIIVNVCSCLSIFIISKYQVTSL